MVRRCGRAMRRCSLPSPPFLLPPWRQLGAAALHCSSTSSPRATAAIIPSRSQLRSLGRSRGSAPCGLCAPPARPRPACSAAAPDRWPYRPGAAIAFAGRLQPVSGRRVRAASGFCRRSRSRGGARPVPAASSTCQPVYSRAALRPAQLPLTTAAARPPLCRPLPLPRPAGRRGTAAMAGPGSYTNGPTSREAEVAPAPKRIKVNSGTWQHFVGPSYSVSGMLLTEHRMTVPLDHSGAF